MWCFCISEHGSSINNAQQYIEPINYSSVYSGNAVIINLQNLCATSKLCKKKKECSPSLILCLATTNLESNLLAVYVKSN